MLPVQTENCFLQIPLNSAHLKKALPAPFSLILDFRKQNTRWNVSKISVNRTCYRHIGSKFTNHSPLSTTWRRCKGHTSSCDWWISIRSVDNAQDWRKFWKRFRGCFVFQSRVSRKTVVISYSTKSFAITRSVVRSNSPGIRIREQTNGKITWFRLIVLYFKGSYAKVSVATVVNFSYSTISKSVLYRNIHVASKRKITNLVLTEIKVSNFI